MIVTGFVRYFFTDAGVVAETRAVHRRGRARLRAAGRAGPAVLRPARVRLRVHRADRGGGDRQRRAGVQAAEEPERGHHPRADGRHRRHDVRRRHRAGAAGRRQVRRAPLRPAGLRELRDRAAAHGHRADRRGGVRRRRLDRLLLHPGRHRAGAHPGRQHRLQRVPAAGLGARAGPVHAPPAAHPRRQAGVQQRHPAAGRLRGAADRRLRRRRHPADPALHHRGVHQLQHRPVGHGAALEPRDAARARPGGPPADAPLADDQHRRRQPDLASCW